jgi:ribonuclease HI
MLEVYVDGGCHGNGTANPVCYGSFKIGDEDIVKLVFPELKTNNEAEYESYISVMRKLGDREAIVYTDSQLVVN